MGRVNLASNSNPQTLNPMANQPSNTAPYTELEDKAKDDHIAKMCGSTYKAASSYLAFMRAVKLRIELEGYTPPPKQKDTTRTSRAELQIINPHRLRQRLGGRLGQVQRKHAQGVSFEDVVKVFAHDLLHEFLARDITGFVNPPRPRQGCRVENLPPKEGLVELLKRFAINFDI